MSYLTHRSHTAPCAPAVQMNEHKRAAALKNLAGFSLVEVMVAMVIGMLGLIVMMQVFALFEGQKRSTTGGSDAQNGGAIALYGVQRDLQQSGYGTSAYPSLGCGLTLRAGVKLNSLAPVTINYAPITGLAGQDANTDTLLVVYSDSNSPTEGNGITVHPAGSNQYSVQTASSFNNGDYVIAFPKNRPLLPAPCDLTLEQIPLVGGVVLPSTVNVPIGSATTMINGTLFNLGPSIKVLAYAIRGGNLTVCDFMTDDCRIDNNAIWTPIASNIASLKAEYGRDSSAPMDGSIDTFDRTPPLSTSCGLVRVSAVRIALVARSTQYDKEIVTNTALNAPAPVNAPTWMGNASNAIVGNGTLGPNTAADEPWKHYRYKVFQTVVPLRNITWMTAQGVAAGC